MAIGTSSGQYFEDAYEQSAAQFDVQSSAERPITGSVPNAESAGYPGSGGALETNVRASNEAGEASSKVSIIRHGATNLNAEGNKQTSQDFIRGHKDIPLNEIGIQEAHKLGDTINKSKDPPDMLVSSDLSRAHDTAKIISEKTGIPLTEVSEGFRPWDVGKYAGKSTKEAMPHLVDFMENKPDEKVPGGESFNEFKERAMANIARVVEENPDKHIGVVTHHRVGQLVRNIDPQTGEVDTKGFAQKGKAPGTIETHEFKMAGDIVPVDFTAKEGSNWQKAGPSTQSPREQALKILNAPATGNVIGFGNRQQLK